MVRQLLLPLLGLALLTAEAAAAQSQTVSAASPASAAKTARTTPRAGRTLTARERKQAEAAAKAAAQNQAVAMAVPAKDNWSGWSNDPLNLPDDGTLYRPHTNVSSAPGMPLNQVSHGVTTDYHGRPIQRATATSSGTTLPTTR